MLLLLLFLVCTGSLVVTGKNIENFDPKDECKPDILQAQATSYVGMDAMTENANSESLKSKLFNKDTALEYSKNAFDLASFVLTIALAVVGISSAVAAIVPGLNVIAFAVSMVINFKMQKAGKKEMITAMNKVREDLTNQIHLRFTQMDEYIDQSSMAIEKSMLDGDYNQLLAYINDCLDINSQKERKVCMRDRCSFAKASLYKFAIHYNEVNAKGSLAEKYAIFSKLQLRRIQSNLILFDSYVRSILVPCESVLFIDKMMGLKSDDKDVKDMAQEDLKEFLKAGGVKKYTLQDQAINYMTNAQDLIVHGYKEAVAEVPYISRVIEANVEILPEGKKKKDETMVVQCRTRMNMMNFDRCDREVTFSPGLWQTRWKEAVKKKWFASEGEFLRHYCGEGNKYNDGKYQDYVKEIKKIYGEQLTVMKGIWDKVTNAFMAEVKKTQKRHDIPDESLSVGNGSTENNM